MLLLFIKQYIFSTLSYRWLDALMSLLSAKKQEKVFMPQGCSYLLSLLFILRTIKCIEMLKREQEKVVKKNILNSIEAMISVLHYFAFYLVLCDSHCSNLITPNQHNDHRMSWFTVFKIIIKFCHWVFLKIILKICIKWHPLDSRIDLLRKPVNELHNLRHHHSRLMNVKRRRNNNNVDNDEELER